MRRNGAKKVSGVSSSRSSSGTQRTSKTAGERGKRKRGRNSSPRTLKQNLVKPGNVNNLGTYFYVSSVLFPD